MISKYTLNSQKLAEPIKAEYTNGVLSGLILPVKYPLKPDQTKSILKEIPHFEQDIESLEAIRITVSKEVGANVKVAMFCELFMKYNNDRKYKATKNDGSILKAFVVTYDILEHYYTTDLFLVKDLYSVKNFTTYYNQILIDMDKKTKGSHPNSWSEKYESKLKTNKEVNEYWAHLRSLGLAPKKDRTGKTTEWIKRELI